MMLRARHEVVLFQGVSGGPGLLLVAMMHGVNEMGMGYKNNDWKGLVLSTAATLMVLGVMYI